jgi:hypothetical protein
MTPCAAEVHGLLAGPALTVHGRAGDGLQDASGEHGVAGDVQGLIAGLGDAARDDVVDRGRLDVVPSEEDAECVGEQGHGVHVRQRTTWFPLAGGSTYDVDDRC